MKRYHSKRKEHLKSHLASRRPLADDRHTPRGTQSELSTWATAAWGARSSALWTSAQPSGSTMRLPRRARHSLWVLLGRVSGSTRAAAFPASTPPPHHWASAWPPQQLTKGPGVSGVRPSGGVFNHPETRDGGRWGDRAPSSPITGCSKTSIYPGWPETSHRSSWTSCQVTSVSLGQHWRVVRHHSAGFPVLPTSLTCTDQRQQWVLAVGCFLKTPGSDTALLFLT